MTLLIERHAIETKEVPTHEATGLPFVFIIAY